MAEHSPPDWTDAFPIRFGACFLLGMIVITGLVWVAAMERWTLQDWIPDEVLFGALTVFWVVVCARFAPPASWRDVALGTAIALALYFLVFLLPPILLIGYPFSGYLLQDILLAVAPYAAGYALALALTFLMQSRNADTKGSP